MNLFASERIEPASIKFPKGFDKLEWKVVKTPQEFDKLARENPVENVVIDSAAKEKNIALSCVIALIESSCDKHVKLPTMMVIGNDANTKKSIDETLAKAKRWIDINSSKGF